MEHGTRANRAPEPSFGGVFSRTFLISLVVGIVLYLLWRDFAQRPLLDPDAESRLVTARGELAADEDSTIALFEASSPSVVSGGAAEEAGIRGTRRSRGGETLYGDLIVGLNGDLIRTNAELQEGLQAFDPGDEVEIEFFRDPGGANQPKKLALRLREL